MAKSLLTRKTNPMETVITHRVWLTTNLIPNRPRNLMTNSIQMTNHDKLHIRSFSFAGDQLSINRYRGGGAARILKCGDAISHGEE